jgi:hypothetical protein
MEKRKRIGYTTSASEMQDRFEEIQTLLGARKVKWSKLRKIADSTWEELGKLCEKTSELRNQPQELMFQLRESQGFFLTMTLLARLGIELTETHERLTSVEKSIAELSRRLKQN